MSQEQAILKMSLESRLEQKVASRNAVNNIKQMVNECLNPVEERAEVPTENELAIESSSIEPIEGGTQNEARNDIFQNEQEAEEVGNIDDPDWVPDRIHLKQLEPGNFDRNDSFESTVEKNKRKRKGGAVRSDWKGMKNKTLREKGENYLGYRKKTGQKQKHDTPRQSRKLGLTCTSEVCRKSKLRQCQSITEVDRKIIFSNFWQNMSWDQRKVYISSLVDYQPTKRKSKSGDSRRSGSFTYSLRVGELRYRVCKLMFLNTLAVKEWSVQNWVKSAVSGIQLCQSTKDISRKENLGELDIIPQGKREFLKNFIGSLQKLPSHYCRQSSTRLYLEPIWGAKSEIFEEYKLKCKDNNQTALSRFTFDTVMQEQNVYLYAPKKDQCNICCGYSMKQIDEDVWQAHIERKKRARVEKEKDKILATEGERIVLAVDVQAVKVSPFLNASALFFKTKLACHNYSVFNLANHEARCYWFNETQAGLCASTFASCLVDYLSEKCKGSKRPIVIYSDGCSYQNKSAALSNAILSFSIHENITIFKKFLEKGHTQMEVDSVHANIETKLKNKSIYLPCDYVKYTQEARKKTFPYETKYLSFNFVKNFATHHLMKYESIRPGRRPGEPTVTDIREIMYTPDGIIKVRLGFESPWINIAKRPNRIEVPHYQSFPFLYNKPIEITKRKWDDLQDLKCVIPTDAHSYYDNLIHD